LLADRLVHELEVSVGLLCILPVGFVVRPLGGVRFAKELRLVEREQVELTADELVEAAAAEDQRSSRYRAR
jgi:hypothetical protein